MTGLPQVSKRRSIAWPRSARALPSNGPCFARSPMSAPATNAFCPAPVSIAPLIASSVATRSAASASSSTTWSFRAFSLSGRLMVISATPSLISNRRVWYPMARILHGECGMRNAECGISARRHSRFDPPLTFRIPHSALRIRFIPMPVQAIAWSPSGAVRIVDQRALPEAKIERDLESGDAVADAIRTLQLRGAPLIPDGAKVLTHCNAGALATGGIGTALAPLYLAHDAGRRVHVFVDETRPVLQGARLTAWELVHAGIPCTVIADAVAGSLMRQAQVDLVIVGADRIAANGDFANKIGTYSLAVLALHHGVPFYCAAPSTTIDAALADGGGIPIEQRAPDEVKSVAGRLVAPAEAGALNPAFDVTPARYVTAFLPDRGLEHPPFRDGTQR